MRQKVQRITTVAALITFFIVLGISLVTIAIQIEPARLRQNSHLDSELHEIQIVVQPGDTLWSIAKSTIPNKDPRDVIGAIRDRNQLSSATVYPGQVLKIAVPDDEIKPLTQLANQQPNQ